MATSLTFDRRSVLPSNFRPQREMVSTAVSNRFSAFWQIVRAGTSPTLSFAITREYKLVKSLQRRTTYNSIYPSKRKTSRRSSETWVRFSISLQMSGRPRNVRDCAINLIWLPSNPVVVPGFTVGRHGVGLVTMKLEMSD